jgi:hypothetical protein
LTVFVFNTLFVNQELQIPNKSVQFLVDGFCIGSPLCCFRLNVINFPVEVGPAFADLGLAPAVAVPPAPAAPYDHHPIFQPAPPSEINEEWVKNHTLVRASSGHLYGLPGFAYSHLLHNRYIGPEMKRRRSRRRRKGLKGLKWEIEGNVLKGGALLYYA